MDRLNVAVIAAILSVAVILVALFLDRRSRTKGPIGGPSMQISLPEPGPITKRLSLAWKLLVVVELLAIVAAFVSSSTILTWLAIGLLVILLAVIQISRIARLSGK